MEEPRDVRLMLAAGAGLLGVLALTGAAMALAYEPDPGAAHASVAAIAPLLRSLHAWAASLALALALVLAVRMFVLGCYARGAMLASVGAVALLLAAFESGVVLPWDERGWEAWRHVRDGAALVGLALGSSEPAATPLALVLGAHVIVGLALVALGAWASRRHARAALLLGSAAAGVAVALALALPAAHGPAPVPGLAVSRPHWPFLWLVPMQEAFGERGLLALPLALATAALLAWRPPSIAPLRVILVLAAALVASLLTLAGGVA